MQSLSAAANAPVRVIGFSDGVFSVLITILVLDLRPPQVPSTASLWLLWPSALSYAVSYLFIGIVWLNHRHLLRLAESGTQRLIWMNFAHLFSVSLIPFSTAWIATTRLSAVPVCLYALVFVVVNTTYFALCDEIVDRHPGTLPSDVREAMHFRSLATVGAFLIAAALALFVPMIGFAVVVVTLALYIRPEAATSLHKSFKRLIIAPVSVAALAGRARSGA